MEIDIKNCTYYFFDRMMNIKNVDSDKIKKTKIQTRYFYFLIRYVTRKSAEHSFPIVNMKKGILKKVMEINNWH